MAQSLKTNKHIAHGYEGGSDAAEHRLAITSTHYGSFKHKPVVAKIFINMDSLTWALNLNKYDNSQGVSPRVYVKADVIRHYRR